MKNKKDKIDRVLKTLLHVLHSSRLETTSPQTNIYVGSGVSISTELSDEEMREEMGSGLIQDDLLTKEELRIATIEGAIPTMIADSGASTTCMQPEEEQGQKSECGRYKWDTLFVKTGQESDRISQMARGDTALGEVIVHLRAFPLRTEAATGHIVRGFMNNLGSMSTMTRNGYTPIFKDNKVSIYDAKNMTITV